MNKLIRIIFSFLIVWYMLIPSAKILWFSEDIKHLSIEEAKSYNKQQGIVVNVKTLVTEKYPVNYDKDVFKRIYEYQIIHLDSQQKDTLLETVKKNTYLFNQLIPTHKLGDTISYYKSDVANPSLITGDAYEYIVNNREGSFIKWLSITLLFFSLLVIYKIIKPILK